MGQNLGFGKSVPGMSGKTLLSLRAGCKGMQMAGRKTDHHKAPRLAITVV